MLCWNCGESIPYLGDKCPHCHSHKKLSQDRFAFAVAGFLVGSVLSAFGAGSLFGMFWFVIGFVGGGVVGTLAGEWLGAIVHPKP